MVQDVKRRAPYYWSDWRDAWDYRVVPATVYMYFAKYAVPCFGDAFDFVMIPFYVTLSCCAARGGVVEESRGEVSC